MIGKYVLGMAFIAGMAAAVCAAPGDDAVIPDSVKKKVKVVTVSHKGGDFADPAAAVASITDAHAGNPYQVLVGPGVYSLERPLVMKQYVSIDGSGRDATTLTGAVSTLDYDASSALVTGADNAGLRDLTIENNGGSAVSIALYNDGTAPVLENVTLKATGGTYNYGIYNVSAAPVLTEVTAVASGGAYNYDVFNSGTPGAGN
jgi:pectin methylesterase-like acyl-CoA thioesterase